LLIAKASCDLFLRSCSGGGSMPPLSPLEKCWGGQPYILPPSINGGKKKKKKKKKKERKRKKRRKKRK